MHDVQVQAASCEVCVKGSLQGRTVTCFHMQHHMSAMSKQARPALRPPALFDRLTAKCLLEACLWLANAECSQCTPVLLYTARPFLSVHSEHASSCIQVYEGTWLGQVVAVKVLDGAAAASQKAMKEVRQCIPVCAHHGTNGAIWVCCMFTGHSISDTLT